MARYTGSISLVDMSDITATAGVGISHSKVLYALSSTGDLPPDLEGASLKIVLSIIDFGEQECYNAYVKSLKKCIKKEGIFMKRILGLLLVFCMLITMIPKPN